MARQATYLHISTAESGLKSDLKIVGTKGSLQIGNGKLDFHTFETDVHEYQRTTDEICRGPDTLAVPVELEAGAGDHPAVYRNFHAAILEGEPISVEAARGVMSLELANALIYSSFTRSVVELPLDRQQYGQLLGELQKKTSQA